ncbi:MAG TPA: CHASE domain-containing protein [Parasulfuritortus sp.]
MKPARTPIAWPRLTWLPGLVLLVALSITFAVWQEAKSKSEAIQQETFRLREAEIEAHIRNRMMAYEQILQGTAGLFAASDEVERGEFKTYVGSLKLPNRYPGIQCLGFSLRLPAGDRTRLVAQLHAQGFPGFHLFPEGQRSLYSAIVYIEPFDQRNRRAFGYDMYSEPVRRAAMDRAWLQDSLAISGKVVLVQEGDRGAQPGFLMYLPVYRQGMRHDTPAARRAALQGWVYAAFRMNDLMQGVSGLHYGETSSTLDVEIFDGTALRPDSLMYDSDGVDRTDSPKPTAYKSIRQIELGGHVWTVAIYSMPAFEIRRDESKLAAIAVSGTVGSLLLAALLWLLISGRGRALRLAAAMNRDVLERERQLKEAQAIAHVGSWDWHVASDRVTCSDEMCRLFGLPPGEGSARLKALLDRIHPDDQERVQVAIETTRANREPYDLTHRIPLSDGSIREVRARGKWTYTADGEAVRLSGTLMDITEQRLAEVALRQALAELDDLYNHAPCGYHSLDGEGRVIRINQTELDWLGHRREEMLGRYFSELYLPESQALFKTSFARFKETGHVRDLEFDLVCKDGTVMTVLLSATAVYDADGKFAMSRTTLYDVTARKRAEKELEQTRTELQRIVDISPAAIYRVQLDPQGVQPAHVAFQSRNIVDLVGYDLEEWHAPGFWEARIHPEDKARVMAAQDDLFRQGSLEHEYRFACRDGRMVWIYDRLVLVRDAAGQAREIIGTWLDITKRVQAEQEMQRLNRFYALLSHANEAIVRLQSEPRLFEELCRLAVDEGGQVLAWVGMLDLETSEVHPVAAAGRDEGYIAFLERNGVFRHNGPTARAILENNHYINGDMVGNPVMGPWRDEALKRGYRSSAAFPLRRNGRPVGALTLYADHAHSFTAEIVELFQRLIEDVSFALDFIDQDKRRRLAELRLARLNEDLELRVAERTRMLAAANKELEAFSYSVSHDLRAPLRSIEGFSQLLGRKYGDRLDETGQDYLQRVQRASKRMGELIDDLLQLSRVSRIELIRETVDLSRIAREVLEDLSARVPERPVEFEVQAGIMAHADGRLIRVVLENLLGNAWKFTARQAQPRIEFGSREMDGRTVYFVRDNGAGFDMQYAGKLFGAFQRLHRAEEFEGTGIGLATVQRIVNRHGGNVWAEAEVGKGASFFFYLD